MTRRQKILAPSAPVPQSDLEAEAQLRRIGDLDREMIRLRTERDDAKAALDEAHGAAVAPLNDEIAALTAGLKTWAEANRQRLTQNGRVKHARLATGLIEWRRRPPRVTVKGADAVIAALEKAGLHRFLRRRVEVNREAVLDDPDAVRGIKGLSVGSAGEDFIAKPNETEQDG